MRRAGVYLWHSVVCLATLALVLAAFWAVSFARSVYQVRDAERLLSELRSVPVGAAGFARVQQLANNFGAVKHCSNDSCRYNFENGFGYTDTGVMVMLRRTEWDYFRLRPWKITAVIQTANGEVTDIELLAVVGHGRGRLYNQGFLLGNMWAWSAVSVVVNSGRFDSRVSLAKRTNRESGTGTGNQIEPGADGILVQKPAFDTPGGGQILDVYLSPATLDNRAVGFNVNLRCATAVLPCMELCQLAPSAWHWYSQYQKSNGWWVEEVSGLCPSLTGDKSPFR